MKWGMIKDFIREVELQENHYKLESTLCETRNSLDTLNRLDAAKTAVSGNDLNGSADRKEEKEKSVTACGTR